MTSIRDLNNALLAVARDNGRDRYYVSARVAARKAAELIGAPLVGEVLVATDEAVCEVKINRRHNLCWAVEAECPFVD